MAIETTVIHITLDEDLDEDLVKATVNFWESSGATHDSAEVTVFVEDRDWSLSELKAEAIQKAKAFLLQAASSPQS